VFRISASLIALAIIFGCGKTDKYGTERSKLSDAKARWERAHTSNVTGYFCNYRLMCFCVFTEPVQMTVSADSIVSIKEIQTRNVLPDSDFVYFWTVEKWFDWIGTTLDKNPYSASIQYDATFGYPRDIYVDFEAGIADDETRLNIDSLRLVYRVAH
jgi:hypothetical protein